MHNNKNRKNIVTLLAIFVAIAIVGFSFTKTQYFKKNFSPGSIVTQDYSEQDIGLVANEEQEKLEPLEANFSTGGMVFDENRVTGAKEWIFLYEDQGMLALLIKLVFNESSVCDLDDGEQICDMDSFVWTDYETDTYFDLDGFREGNEVTVIRLKLHRM